MSNNLLYKKYSKELSKMVSNNDFKKMLGNSVENKIIKYSDFENIDDLNDILTEPKDYRIILIETQKNTGHWCCLLKNNNCFEWFDSYSLYPDQEFEFISPEMQKILDEDNKPLSKLLNKFKQNGGKWDYNKIKFQEQKPNINTCGRYCSALIYLFLKYNYNLKQFQKYFFNLKKKTNIPYDILICDFTKVLN